MFIYYLLRYYQYFIYVQKNSKTNTYVFLKLIFQIKIIIVKCINYMNYYLATYVFDYDV